MLILGTQVTVKVIDVDYRWSPLVQGGLQIPVLVSVAIDCLDSNKGKIKKLDTNVTKNLLMENSKMLS